MSFPGSGSWMHYLAIAGKLHPFEWALIYSFVLFLFCAPSPVMDLVRMNALAQVCIFLPLVQVPVALTGHMLYVDIGWPVGLVAIGGICLVHGTGFWLRRWIMSFCFILHGGRMALGAIYLFGQSSNFKYRFREDLPRYQYAKYRWSSPLDCGMPTNRWFLKQQHDTLTQGFLNVVLTAVPAVLAASNPLHKLHGVEVAGFSLWIGAWVLENMADTQKIRFVAECKRLSKAEPSRKESLRTATLGMAPFDKYFLWARCRHPNYFAEWLCWVGLSLAAAPSLFSHGVVPEREAGVCLLFGLALLAIPRLMYDCLVHWTGAGPAEFYSQRKRHGYRAYQQTVRCFFPFPLPLVNHHMQAGWPEPGAAD